MENQINWNYKHESGIQAIPVGEHRIRIADVSKEVSKSGKDMIKLVFDVSGFNSQLYHYIVFLPDYPEITNRNLTQLFDSFGISEGDFNLANWKGKVGGCKTKEDEYGTKVQYFLSRKKVEQLPQWQEKTKGNSGVTPIPVIDNGDLPF